ncbi:pentatricopeptide repeat-containing protein At4g35850, mitochondrial-like [Humulus lupulus]|uniref:pentatricopeptide repeat-containing protein At4g35850, mitochondrial-like n=1 Tax=Humulus lupulus TaxID=3486 RepID=UPI002B401FE9|nr:pentatricopeptide repeat-containing protein At4g35850, mitochondrial-like [Humulus lupulus]
MWRNGIRGLGGFWVLYEVVQIREQSNAIAMRLHKLITGQHRSLAQLLGRRYFSAAASTEEYAKRNYANNVSEYNTVIDSVSAQRRHFLLRDVYEDMVWTVCSQQGTRFIRSLREQ